MAPWHCSAARAAKSAASDAYALAMETWSELELHQRIREMMLHRLKAADGAAELFADLGVLDGDVDEVPSETEEHGRCAERAAVESACHCVACRRAGRDARRRRRRPSDAEQAARPVDRMLGREFYGVAWQSVQLIAALK
jgi:hypothetical protein